MGKSFAVRVDDVDDEEFMEFVREVNELGEEQFGEEWRGVIPGIV